ncbi:hypothetical protein VPH35_012463 [Triticum aestivum]|uniref:DUF4220 domain-containing protein n=1 Tax=Aegilops tauschii TaxID=37682 RepID=R7WFL0_AEGTA
MVSLICAGVFSYKPETTFFGHSITSKWCKSLYKKVKKDADRLLPSSIATTSEEDCRQLIKLLSTRSEHEVLKNGVVLGGQLAEIVDGEEIVWKALAKFWSELILYVSPSDNMDGHAEAIARGGELITLLWALQAHLGIVSRPDSSDAITNAAAPV